MRIAIASDHAGFELKEIIKSHLKSNHFDVIDLGTDSVASVDYPDFAKEVATLVSKKKVERGVLVCGSGIGMCMAANRLRGVRAFVANDKFDAEMSRRHNDSNVICFGARKIDQNLAISLLDIWLNTGFEGGRHEGRIKKMC